MNVSTMQTLTDQTLFDLLNDTESDRIEINSPGGPFGNVTPQNFGQPGITDYRNPNIADVLKTFGFIQAFGRGIVTTQRMMQQNGNPPPEFVTNQSTVTCILRAES
jgi:ATP-dependent DNA helicase RecG